MASSTTLTDQDTADPPRRPRNYGRWRAATLASVYILMGLHYAHWKIAGKSLAPLELNEVMYSLELGIITAGFLLMLAAAVSVLTFGRFFCSWGCHILALEDLSAWLLAKVGIRPRPLRSRLLLLVPPAALFYMFVWPQIERMIAGRPMPTWRLLEDKEGWASFVTEDFARNLPGVGIALTTFAVCGFAIVWVLGTRSFCRYVCPYGALFALTDRVTPGRIVSRGGCTSCGTCTANCQSHVRVHEELAAFGTVIDSGCLKDLDCIAVCPNNAVGYGFTRPPLFRLGKRHKRPRPAYSFSLAEEILMILLVPAGLVVFRGLYGLLPFLLSLAMACLVAYGTVACLRLFRRPHVRFANLTLKSAGRLTGTGRAFSVLAVLAVALFAHSAFIRYHEHFGEREFLAVLEMSNVEGSRDGSAELVAAVASPLAHLEACERWGLMRQPYLDRRLATLHLVAGAPERAAPYLRRVRDQAPDDSRAVFAYSEALHRLERRDEARQVLQDFLSHTANAAGTSAERLRPARARAHELVGRFLRDEKKVDEATAAFSASLELEPKNLDVRLALAELLASKRQFDDAIDILSTAVEHDPKSAAAHYSLGVLLTGKQPDAALEHYRTAIELDPDDPEIHNNLGHLLTSAGEIEAAERHLRRAIELRADFAHPHFNLARLLFQTRRFPEAQTHLEKAAELDPAYAEMIRRMGAPAGGSPQRP